MVTNGKYSVSSSGLIQDKIGGKPGITIQYKRANKGKREFSVFSDSNAASVIADAYDNGPKHVIIKFVNVNTAKYG